MTNTNKFMGTLLLVLIVFVIFVAYGLSEMVTPTPTPPPCNAQLYLDTIMGVLGEWDDEMEIAVRTPRSSLADSISRLQRIKREFGDIDFPECAGEVQDAGEYMLRRKLDLLLSFLADEDDNEFTHKAELSATTTDLFENALSRFTVEYGTER